MGRRDLRVERQKLVPVDYRGENVGEHRIDLLIDDTVIVENKAVKAFDEVHLAQLLSYLRAANKKVGLLLHCAGPKIQIKGIIL